jgi:hypothetical protein
MVVDGEGEDWRYRKVLVEQVWSGNMRVYVLHRKGMAW